MTKAIFFDRDGTLLVEAGYINHPSLVAPYRFSLEAVAHAKRSGFLAVVVTNQSGVARGWLSEQELGAVHKRMVDAFAAGGAAIDAVFYCPHHPQGTVPAYRVACACRKPGALLGVRAAEQFAIDLARSYVIGDKLSDIGFADAVGARSCLVRTGFGRSGEARLAPTGRRDVHVAENALEAVLWAVEEDILRS